MTALLNEALMRGYLAVRGLGARLREERGQDLLEYALLGGLIAAGLVAVGAIAFSGPLQDMADGIGRCINFDDLADPCAT
jgi:Flp pilus assembly pilin Flp